MKREKMEYRLKKELDAARYAHTLGVEQTVREMASPSFLCGGLPVGRKSTRSTLPLSSAARASATCPQWMGLKLPPINPISGIQAPPFAFFGA